MVVIAAVPGDEEVKSTKLRGYSGILTDGRSGEPRSGAIS